MLEWESNKVYVYKVPNLFPTKEDSGYTELSTQGMLFHTDWNMLIGAYNRVMLLINSLSETQLQLLRDNKNFLIDYSFKNFFIPFEGQLHINSCWLKLVDICKWYNSVKQFKTKP